MWLTLATWLIIVCYKVLHFNDVEDQEALGYKTLSHTNAIASHRVYVLSLYFRICGLIESPLRLSLRTIFDHFGQSLTHMNPRTGLWV